MIATTSLQFQSRTGSAGQLAMGNLALNPIALISFQSRTGSAGQLAFVGTIVLILGIIRFNPERAPLAS